MGKRKYLHWGMNHLNFRVGMTLKKKFMDILPDDLYSDRDFICFQIFDNMFCSHVPEVGAQNM